MELFPLVLSLRLWCPLMANHHVLFIMDNQAVSFCVNKQTSRDPLLMRLIRSLVVTSMIHNIMFQSKWIAGASNKIADLLSRFSLQQGGLLAPWLQATLTQMPEYLQPCVKQWTTCCCQSSPLHHGPIMPELPRFQEFCTSTFNTKHWLPATHKSMSVYIAFLYNKQLAASQYSPICHVVFVILLQGHGREGHGILLLHSEDHHWDQENQTYFG